MRWLIGKDQGQGFVEYALILVFVVLVAITGLAITGTNVQQIYCSAVKGLNPKNDCGHYFVDNFNDLSNWTIINGTWQAINGFLTGGINEGRIFHDVAQTDYTVNVKDVTLSQGNGYGVYFRATNTSLVNGYDFQYDPGYGSGGSFIMRKWVNGNELGPFAVASAPPGFNWNQPNRQIQVVVKGNTFTAYIDGNKVLTGTDSSYTSGGVGLRTWDNTKVQADSITVDAAP